MATDPSMAAWSMTPLGGATSPSTLSPQQVAQIQAGATAMMQPSQSMPSYTPPSASPQQQQAQQQMLQGLFGGGGSTVPNYGQQANAVGLGAGTGGLSFPMFQ
jgi:hypothetical protein